MNIDNLINKQSFHPTTIVSAQQEQQDKKIVIRKVDREIWSVECKIEELELDLSGALENITFFENEHGQE